MKKRKNLRVLEALRYINFLELLMENDLIDEHHLDRLYYGKRRKK